MSERDAKSWPIRLAVAVVVCLLVALPNAVPVAAQTEPTTEPTTAAAEMVVPSPGTTVATPETQITLRGAGLGPIEDLEVVGESSGSHTGTFLSHSDGGGVSFVPSTPFVPGEQVRVTGPSVLGAGAVREFAVRRPGDQSVLADARDDRGRLDQATPAATGSPPFLSRPDIFSPGLSYNAAPVTNGAGLLLGDTLALGPNPFGFGLASGAVWIADDRPGTPDLVWSGGARLAEPGNLRVETWNGEPVLVWSESATAEGQLGVTAGEWVFVDQHYTEVTRVRPVGFAGADNHDLVVDDVDGTVSFVIYDSIDRRSIDPGAPAGETVIEGVIQRVDVATGAVLFEWHSGDHVPLADGAVPGSPDYLHINSIERLPDGSYLVSARNTNAVYDIDGTTGEVNWVLGGTASDFTFDPPGSGPSFQHDARLWSDGTIGIFNNGTSVSSADRYALDFSSMTATRVAHRRHDPDVFGLIIGSYRELSGGSSLVSWGSAQIATEYDAAGDVVAELALDGLSYRIVRDAWVGLPLAPPDVAVRAEATTATASVSWNGATEVATWRAIVDDGPLGPPVSRAGFETGVPVPTNACEVVVVGYDADDAELGRSGTATGPACAGIPQGVVMHRPGEPTDRYLDGATAHDVDLSPDAAIPVVGDFFTDEPAATTAGAGDLTSAGHEILWYAAGPAADAATSFDGATIGTDRPTGEWGGSVVGTYTPVVGDFDGSGCDDIFWYAPGAPADHLWLSTCERPAPGQPFNSAFVSRKIQVSGTYLPLVGEFNNCGCESIFWYAPGPVRESIWTFGGDGRLRVNQQASVNGGYFPVVYNPTPSGLDRIVWYRPGTGPDYEWAFSSLAQLVPANIASVPRRINGSYYPLAVAGGAYLTGSDAEGDAILWNAGGPAADYLWSGTAAGAVVSTPVAAPPDGTPHAAPLDGCDGADSVWFHDSGPATAGTIWHPDGWSKRTVETAFSGDGDPVPLGLLRAGCS